MAALLDNTCHISVNSTYVNVEGRTEKFMERKRSIIQLFDVSKQYGAGYALKNITLSVKVGDLVFITGASGAGKSTLLNLLYLATPVTRGQIIVGGMNLARLSPEKIPYLRRRIGVIFQDFKLISHRSVFDNISLVLEAAGQPPAVIKKKVEEVLERTGMTEYMNALPPSLSGGQQQKVAVARAVVGDPDIILADEPTGSLDACSAEVITRYLMEYKEKGTTILIASHNTALINSTGFDVLYTLEAGQLAQPGENICAAMNPIMGNETRGRVS
ncbi:cell division ATP-binding protein FtsE [Desulfocicer vacuolatum DSM 3385]|uniref:Cell division ATP-binding protein FtsE n=1 Tax=Desulfocicer vacuolatum DSM 3385 TaxID=1121400 RepID=A0A1W1YNP1_9BACT|nr:ATP-binding cassette domain-containing protein [Desulfocicer vacuolatum]SMC37779.1 cell division ATP-binding protein FtsE [Desulfocicer vacuolatum DSM 3385]